VSSRKFRWDKFAKGAKDELASAAGIGGAAVAVPTPTRSIAEAAPMHTNLDISLEPTSLNLIHLS
jgi:hypothetical protein